VDELLLRLSTLVAFLLVLVYRERVGREVGSILVAYFIAATALLLDWYFSNWLVRVLGIPLQSPAGYALDKVEGTLLITLIVVVLTLGSGDTLASLYLKQGKMERWLIIGATTFVFFAATAPVAAQTLFNAATFTFSDVVNWAPWILVFVLANALGEELIFRGVLLPHIEQAIGGFPAVLLVTVAFTLWHLGGANYTETLPLYLGIVFLLGLAWAYVVRSTDSLWGAVLFHAGTDIPIVIGLFSLL
jgi:membrane protease YdiL (CAAX protease family)